MSMSVLIVGLGQISVGYDLHHEPTAHIYTHARAFSQHQKFYLIAGVDPEEQKRRVFTKVYNCPAYDSVEAALERHQPDFVVIAVPTGLHGQVLQRVLERSHPKMILCEKPISNDVNEARNMVRSCADRGVGFYVNYMRRSDPGVIEIKKRIAAGEFGEMIKGVAWYSKGFLHNGSHIFNLLEYWLGPMQDSIMLNRGRIWDNSDPEPDVYVAFERGCITFLAAWEEAFSHYTLELLSPSGRLRYEQGGELIQWQPAGPDPHFQGYTVLAAIPEIMNSGMGRYQLHVAEQCSNVLHGQDAQLCSGADALQTLETMKRVLEWR